MAHRGDPWDRSQRVAQNGTFNSNPVCAAAAIATLELVADGSLHARANKIGDELRNGLSDAMKRLGVPGTTFGEVSIIHVSFEGRPGLAGFDRPRREDLYHACAGAPQQWRGLRLAPRLDLGGAHRRPPRAYDGELCEGVRGMAADGDFKGM